MNPKIRRPKPCQLMFASLVTLDGFHLLLSTQLTADLTPEQSIESMFHLLSHIYAKTPFCCNETVANNTLNRRRVVVFDLLSKRGTNFEHSFFSDKCSCKMVNNCLLHAISIYGRLKRICGVFSVFRRNYVT